MTELQRQAIAAVRRAHPRWYRADGPTERSPLASLYRHAKVLERRPWRGRDGEPHAAYEYRFNERWSALLELTYVPAEDPRCAHRPLPSQAQRDELLISAIAGQIGDDLEAAHLDLPDDLEIGERALAILDDPARLSDVVLAGILRPGAPRPAIIAAIRRITAGRL